MPDELTRMVEGLVRQAMEFVNYTIYYQVRGGLRVQVRCNKDRSLQLLIAQKGTPPSAEAWQAVCQALPEPYRQEVMAPYHEKRHGPWNVIATNESLKANAETPST